MDSFPEQNVKKLFFKRCLIFFRVVDFTYLVCSRKEFCVQHLDSVLTMQLCG